MCESCWNDAGRPTAVPESIAEFIGLFNQLYEVEPMGGPLHSVLDDWNLDGEIYPSPGLDCDDETYELCDRISRLLNAMTVPERYASLAMAEGFFGLEDGTVHLTAVVVDRACSPDAVARAAGALAAMRCKHCGAPTEGSYCDQECQRADLWGTGPRVCTAISGRSGHCWLHDQPAEECERDWNASQRPQPED